MDYTDDEIRKLMEEATPGPWRGDRNDGTVKYEIRAGDEDNPVTVLSVDHKNATYGFGCSPNEGDRYADNPDADERLCLAAPTLARLLLSARAELAAVREAVAPLGSIPPAEHARAVREAVHDVIVYGASRWPRSAVRDRLIATLTRHGTPQPEAERLADGAQETTP